METGIVTKEIVSEQVIKDFLLGSDTKLTDEQTKLFVNIAKSCNLNPFKREIYAIGYQNYRTGKADVSIVTGYQVYIDRATASGFLDGWNCELLIGGDGKMTGAKVTIYRKDWRNPFVWDVNIREFAKMKDGQPMGMRKQMPGFMIKKVAIGQAFRLAFPNELGGFPYLQEEITSETEDTHKKTAGETVTKESETISSEKEVEANVGTEEIKQSLEVYSELSGQPITKSEHGYSLEKHGIALSRDEQKLFKEIEKSNPDYKKEEIIKKMKDPKRSPTDGDLPF